jgi:hypothetical protein
MYCDICNAAGSGTIVSAADMRQAVFTNKFDPFAAGLFSDEFFRMTGKSRAQAYQAWLPMVQENATDWNLCPRCFAAIKTYLEKTGRLGSGGKSKEPPRRSEFRFVGQHENPAGVVFWLKDREKVRDHDFLNAVLIADMEKVPLGFMAHLSSGGDLQIKVIRNLEDGCEILICPSFEQTERAEKSDVASKAGAGTGPAKAERIKAGVFCVICGISAVFLFSNGHEGWGAVLAILALLALAGAQKD